MPKPDEEEFKKLKWLLERLGPAEDFCEPYFDRAKRFYQLYRFGSAVKEADWPYVNRVRSRDILAFIEDSTAIIIQTLFATMPFFSTIPRETRLLMMNYDGIDPMLIGDQISRCLDYQISHEDTEFFIEMVDYIKSGDMMGNSYMGVYPKFDADGDFRIPLLKGHDYWDVLPILGAKRVSRAKGVFVREFCSIEDLELANYMGTPIYKNLDKIGKIGSSQADPQKDWHRALLQEVGMQTYSPDDKSIEVIHYLSGGHIISFANRMAIIRDSNKTPGDPQIYTENNPTPDQLKPLQPFPYDMPIVQYKFMPVPYEFFGMGIPEVLEVLQEDKNLIRSARRDNIDLVIQTILKARAGADINFDLIKHYPGAIWPLENLNDIEAFETKDVTQSSYQEEAMRTQDMENALSLFGYARGMTPQHSEQPTTVMKLQQASLNRLDLSVKLAEFGVLQNIATRIVLLTRRYMSQATYEAIIGDQDAGFYRLTEEDIRRFYHFKPVGSSITNIRELRQKQIETAMQMIMGLNPQMMQANIEPFTINLYEAVKTALDSIDIKNVDRILVKLEQQQPMQNPIMGGQMGGQQGMPQGNEMEQLAQIMYGGGQ